MPHGDGKPAALAPDPADGSVWAASDRAVYHYSAAGALLAARDLKPEKKDVRDLALSSDAVPPEIEIVAPAGGASLRDPLPEITVTYSDIGSGVDPATLALTANGDDLEVTCTTTEAGATCTPSNPLPDGSVALTATVHDRAGNASEPATVAFTVDTVAPTITITSHTDGALTNQRAHLILGYLSEDAALAVNATPVAVDPDLAFAVGPVTLTEGLNTFAVAATDPAGNTADLALTLVLDTIPPAAVDAAKVTLTAPDGGEVDVIGAAGASEAASLVTITNAATTVSVVATAGTDGSFVATLAAGSNDTLSLAARDAAGNTGAAVQIAVPGGLPPDPATVA
ncbi:MAG: Ig-like domain-containing protein, partial [Acidobacteriota bacterium]